MATPLPRDSWENQKLDSNSASPCWQRALRFVRYLWVKKKKRCLGLDLQVCWSVLAAPLRPLNTSTGQPWELSLAQKECSSKASTHTWLQHEWPLKGTGLLYATHMLTNKAIKLGVSMCDKYCHQHVHDHKPAQPVPPKLHCSITTEPQAALTVTIWLQLKHHF